MKPLKLINSFRPIALTLACVSLLTACSKPPYPTDIQHELFTYCQSGIESGLIQVQHGEDKALDGKDIEKLCTFRVKEFMKEVSLENYLSLQQHIYDNFQRAYANKYVLKDIYETLSPKDKQTNAMIAMIIFGLEPKSAEAQ